LRGNRRDKVVAEKIRAIVKPLDAAFVLELRPNPKILTGVYRQLWRLADELDPPKSKSLLGGTKPSRISLLANKKALGGKSLLKGKSLLRGK
jgi:hypothetical protein